MSRFRGIGLASYARMSIDGFWISELARTSVTAAELEVRRRQLADLSEQFNVIAWDAPGAGNAIPGAELQVITAAGHVSNMEQPTAFSTQGRDFCLAV